jgi:hypothetical protein
MKVVVLVLLSYILLGVTDKKVIIKDRNVRDESLYRSDKVNDIEDELPGRI